MTTITNMSADLFQSESVLDHIVINRYLGILQTPINHCCNTVEAPILQIVICLYCRVQFAGLHFLKWVRQMGNWLPQVATGCPKLLAWMAANPPEIHGNLDNRRKSMKNKINAHINWQGAGLPPPSQAFEPFSIQKKQRKSIQIHNLAPIFLPPPSRGLKSS